MYSFASNTTAWFDSLGLKKKRNKKPRRIIPYDDIMDDVDKWSLVPVSQRQKSLIREWEHETRHTWPAGATPHHIIPLKNGGSNTWWFKKFWITNFKNIYHLANLTKITPCRLKTLS